MPKLRQLPVVIGMIGAFCVASVPPALGEPPPWAPAHGYRAKQKHKEPRHAVFQLPAFLDGGTCRPAVIDGEVAGGLIGAAIGGLAGSQVGKGRGKLAATAIGTLAGFVLGQEVGRDLAQPDEYCFTGAFEHAPDGQAIAWRNPDQGAQYVVEPQRTFRSAEGRYCREYTADAIVGGKAEQVYGTACREPDGNWRLID